MSATDFTATYPNLSNDETSLQDYGKLHEPYINITNDFGSKIQVKTDKNSIKKKKSSKSKKNSDDSNTSEKKVKQSLKPPIVSLTSTNLFAEEESHQGLYHFVYDDLINNLTIVSIPGIFTNSIWRLMNLFNIAVSHDKFTIIYDTIFEIATVVWIVCTIIDLFRQYIICYYLKHYSNDDINDINSIHISLKKSIHLGFKFFGGCIGWTIGYELVADDHQLYSSKQIDQITFHALGAAIGTFIGLVLSIEILGYWEKYIMCNKDEHYQIINHRGALGVGFKGLLEGAIWSIIGDLNIYKKFNIWNHSHHQLNYDFIRIIDCLCVGISASLCFSLMGIISSIFGYYYLLNEARRQQHENLYDTNNDEEDDDDISTDEEEESMKNAKFNKKNSSKK